MSDPITQPSGSWSVHRAIYDRWTEDGLDAIFRAFWTAAASDPVLYEAEAKPALQGPYCIYEATPSVPVFNSTAKAQPNGKPNPKRQQRLLNVPIMFRIYANDNAITYPDGTPHNSPKRVAIHLAEQVALAFDRGQLNTSPDDFVDITRTSDYSTRDDAEGASWTLNYTIAIDGEMPLTP